MFGRVSVLFLFIECHPRERVFLLLQGVLALEPLVLFVEVFLLIFLIRLFFLEVKLKANILVEIHFLIAD